MTAYKRLLEVWFEGINAYGMTAIYQGEKEGND